MNSTLSAASAPPARPGRSVLGAAWVGSVAHARVAAGQGEGAVHAVFDGAINVLLAGGLVSLVPEVAGRGPLNISLRPLGTSPRMSSLGVRAGDMVRVRGSTLELGERLRVSFRAARVFTPEHRFALPILDDEERIAENLEAARKTALLFGRMGGLGGLLAMLRPAAAVAAEATAWRPNIFASAALGRIVRLEEAFLSEDEHQLKDAVKALIGLGPGLTPSSDDMLAGLVLLSVLYAENRAPTRHAIPLLAQVTATEAGDRTTLLSEEYLVQAALGNGNEWVVRLCAAVLTGDRESVQLETRRVLSMGETSGTDTVFGVLLGVTLCEGRRSGLVRLESKWQPE